MNNQTYRMLYATVLFCMLIPVSLYPQTQQQIDASDRFITALLSRDWKALYRNSSKMLLAQMDSTKYGSVVSYIESEYGKLLERRLSNATEQKGYAVMNWYAAFEKDTIGFRVIIDSSNLASGIWFRPIEPDFNYPPPTYADTASFTEMHVIFDMEHKLPGTFAIPKGKGPFPTVLLLAGSGPNDRDETANGNKPLRDIAWGLATKGIASFRYDKRTYVDPKSFDDKVNTVEDEVIVDALTALHFMANREWIDRDHIYLLGHSLGATLAPEIASRSDVECGVIMLAAPARTLVEVIIDQLEFIKAESGTTNSMEAAFYDQQIATAQKILSGEAEMRDKLLGVSANYYYTLNTYKQIDKALTLDEPLFIAQGGKDYQVTEEDFNMWKEALSGKNDVTFRFYPDCYHLFIPTDEKPGRSNYNTPGHVTEKLINDLTEWVTAN